MTSRKTTALGLGLFSFDLIAIIQFLNSAPLDDALSFKNIE